MKTKEITLNNGKVCIPTSEAAKMLDYSRPTILRMITAGVLRYKKLSTRKIYVYKDDVLDLLNSR